MKFRIAERNDKEAMEYMFDLYWTDSFRENLSQKLDLFLQEPEKAQENNLNFVIAENDGEVVGVAAQRDCPEHMMQFTKTNKPAEFYVSAVKSRGKGVGTFLRERRLSYLRDRGYTEVVFFSGETHKDSWDFHDKSEFERVGVVKAPNGESGIVWRAEL